MCPHMGFIKQMECNLLLISFVAILLHVIIVTVKF